MICIQVNCTQTIYILSGYINLGELQQTTGYQLGVGMGENASGASEVVV